MRAHASKRPIHAIYEMPFAQLPLAPSGTLSCCKRHFACCNVQFACGKMFFPLHKEKPAHVAGVISHGLYANAAVADWCYSANRLIRT